MKFQRWLIKTAPMREIISAAINISCLVLVLMFLIQCYSNNTFILQMYDKVDSGWDVTDERLSFLEDKVLELEEIIGGTADDR